VKRAELIKDEEIDFTSEDFNIFYGKSPRVQNSGQRSLEVSTYGAEQESILPHSNFSKRLNLEKAENRFQAEVEDSIQN